MSQYDRIEVLIKTYYGTYYILSTIQTFIYSGLDYESAQGQDLNQVLAE
jgi:hypothetical protein